MLGSYEEVNIIWVIEENPNRHKWCTMCTPFVKLEKEDW
jgi:hypothetical protein